MSSTQTTDRELWYLYTPGTRGWIADLKLHSLTTLRRHESGVEVKFLSGEPDDLSRKFFIWSPYQELLIPVRIFGLQRDLVICGYFESGNGWATTYTSIDIPHVARNFVLVKRVGTVVPEFKDGEEALLWLEAQILTS